MNGVPARGRCSGVSVSWISISAWYCYVKKAKVLFDYSAQEDDELTLNIGDIITEVEPADTGWCKGLLAGKRGMFPDNFVQILEEEDKKAPLPPAAAKKPSKRSKKKKMKIMFAYTAENTDELSLEVGDVVEILKDVEEGWAEGTTRGRKGVFPTNFGEYMQDSSESEESADGGLDKKEEPPAKVAKEETHNEEQLSTTSQKKVKGVGFGNIFGDGPIKLRQRSIGEADKSKNHSSAAAKPKDTSKDAHPSTIVTKPKKLVTYCKVMFDYKMENDDELELQKGDIVVIVDKEGGDEGWWEGEKTLPNGKKKRGVFPDNFVVELSPEESREHEKQLQQTKTEPNTSKDVKFAKSPSARDAPSASAKKSAPMVPPPPSQSAKPAMSLDNGEVDEDADGSVVFDEATTTDHTLTHIKRAAGPKNRRKPGAAERREKAQSAIVEDTNGEAAVESEEEKPHTNESPEAAPKRESAKRGVAVLPGLGGSPEGSGETPSWLQNLKSRQSQKRPPGASPSPMPAAKPTSPADAKPNWLQNLKKRQSSEFPTPAGRPKSPERAAQPAKPPEKVAMQPPTKPANGHTAAAPAKPPGPAKAPQKPSAPPTTEKPLAAWQIERQQKARKSKEGSEEHAPEAPVSAAAGEPAATPPAWKNSLSRKSPTAAQPQKPAAEPAKKEVKPPIGTPIASPAPGMRPKPALPKSKPPPAAKPASSSQVEELKEEVKQMKDAIEKMKEEMKKEMQKLTQELQDERKQRITLQGEVAKLKQQISS